VPKEIKERERRAAADYKREMIEKHCECQTREYLAIKEARESAQAYKAFTNSIIIEHRIDENIKKIQLAKYGRPSNY